MARAQRESSDSDSRKFYGKPIEPVQLRAKGGRSLSFREVRFEPGPGATAKTKASIQSRNERVLGQG